MPPTSSPTDTLDPGSAGPDAVVVFRVGAWRLGLPVDAVVEALPAARIAPLPGAPAAVAGYLDVRGAPLPVFDLRVVLGTPAVPLRPSHHFLVCRTADRRVILWADRVLGLNGSLRPAGRNVSAAERSGHVGDLARSEDGIVLIQDLAPLLRPGDEEAVRAALRALDPEGAPS